MFYLEKNEWGEVFMTPEKQTPRYVIGPTRWDRDSHEEYLIHFSEIFEGQYGSPTREQNSWATEYLTGFTYKQLLILAEECRNDPDLLQKVVEEYHYKYQND